MYKFILTVLILNHLSLGVLACNRGGPMGFAHKDPGMLSVNITFSPTFAFASTSGTSECKNWDYIAEVRRQFVQTQWALLKEESSRGEGAHLAVLSDMMGCLHTDHLEFIRMLKQYYPVLFKKNTLFEAHLSERFLEHVGELVQDNINLSCSS